MFSYYLIQSERETSGGFTRRALGSSMTESPLLSLSAAVTHFNSTLFLSHWNPSTMTFNKGRRVKTWLFLHILSPRLGRGPSKGINQCSLTALPSGNDLSLFCAQKWHINLKMDMHKLYIQLLRLCFSCSIEGGARGQKTRQAACKAKQTSLFWECSNCMHAACCVCTGGSFPSNACIDSYEYLQERLMFLLCTLPTPLLSSVGRLGL